MSFYDLIVTKRSVRRFKQDPIPDEIVSRIMEAARQAPSGANIQPVRYIVVHSPDMCGKVFENTAWAGYLKNEGTPKEGERPVLYVVLLTDTELRKDGAKHDCGAAAQNMMLAAWEEGIGSCWIGALKREPLKALLNIEDRYEIDTVIAFGYADEQVVSEDAKDDIKYYRDENKVHHVPKRTMDELVLNRF